MEHNVYLYLACMAMVTLAVRILPLTLIQRQITSPFIRSFLYYVPYITLAVMTFPAMILATHTLLSGVLALAVGIVLAWRGAGLFKVAVACCVCVFIVELLVVV